jgi:hypothetical protein
MTVGGRMIGKAPDRFEHVPSREAALREHVPRGDSRGPGDQCCRDATRSVRKKGPETTPQ